MKDNKSIKALKKQMAAAVAMVLVAAVALGSSTYAWFVSNNNVEATTTTISAQSNAPFLKIGLTQTLTGTAVTSTTPTGNTALYPAQVVGTITSGTEAKFESAYASAANSANELANSRYTVGTNGTAEEAVTAQYALKQTFYIGTDDAKAGSFQNLKVDSVAINDEGTSKLQNALRVLVVGEDGWVVYDKNGNVTTYKNASGADVTISGQADALVIDDTIAANASGKVDAYIYYDGADSDVKTTQLADLTAVGMTITFTATPVATDGSVVNSNNNVNP